MFTKIIKYSLDSQKCSLIRTRTTILPLLSTGSVVILPALTLGVISVWPLEGQLVIIVANKYGHYSIN